MALVIFGSVCIYADIIYKKNGEKIEGTVTDASVEGQIGINTGNRVFYILKTEIEKIEYSAKEVREEGPNPVLIIAITACCLLTFLLVMAGRSI